MRSAAPALAVTLAALACTSAPPAEPCPGTPVATFGFKGTLVAAGDSRLEDPVTGATLDPVPGYADCTPDPFDPAAPVRYPQPLPFFDATLAAEDATSSAALCRSNGVVLSGTRTGPSSYSVEADGDAVVLCNSACGATLRSIVAGAVVPGTGGARDRFQGILVEVLAAARGSCDGCLPPLPDASPPTNACAARYVLTGVAR